MKSRGMPFYFAVAAFFMVVPMPAGAIQFDTGKWEITMESHNPVRGQPVTETTIECIQNRHFDPAKVMLEDNICRMTDKQELDNMLSWKMECGGGDMPVFYGEGTFISHGSSAEGRMKMIIKMGADTVEMKNQWHGKRIAETCDSM